MDWKFGDPGYINIRGTNGTGKSTIIRKYITPDAKLMLMEEHGCYYYDCGTHFVVGKYETDCGGLDAVRGTYDKKTDTGMQSFEAGQKTIMKLAKIKTTFAEGVLASTTFKGTQVIADDLKAVGIPTFWFTIDISPEEVFNSILLRRVKKGNLEPIPTDNVCAKFRPVMASHNKAVDHGILAFFGNRSNVAMALDMMSKDLMSFDTKNSNGWNRKFDIDTRKVDIKVWEDKKEVAPTQEMIDQHAPKPTTTGLGGFFV